MSDISKLVFMAKLADQTERYDDMVQYMKQVLELSSELSSDERNLFSVAYKNKVGQRRSAWRGISAYELQEKFNSKKGKSVSFYKKNIEIELDQICREVISLVDKILIDHKQTNETSVFYLKMKGDYNRYLAEFTQGNDLKTIIDQAKQNYNDALEKAVNMSPTNPLRLGTALNYSVFYYEVLSDIVQATKIAQESFDLAIQELDNLEEDQYKDTTTIMQLMRDNLTNWNADKEEAKLKQ